jgi:hypothetical protein
VSSRSLAVTFTALALGLPCHALAESFNAKPGAWEITVTTLTTGNPMSPSALAEMTPENRAKVEKALKERDGKPITERYKTCITQNELDQDYFLNSEADARCTKKIISKTPTRLELEQTCPAPRNSTGHATIEAKTPESLVAAIDTLQVGSTGTAHVDIKGKWLGASCEGIGRE